ncbi:carboxymuconolactone decarboxylase family protein [Streptomyces griseus]|uniref:carboxymuconolactone decarboxylase family protein n=1 Tax=Streptomyces TaxID=1883 RepID=UPI0029C2BD03|nr:carboxymuconolactone decarboxylase family protein [Streptomyces sp. ID01-9D]MDX5575147.1 carboxymuconolactone decarboxylase family protein [Streptomyces sp. ID01-9D]WTC90341.1 carboxymuconolactone decarboxylase family protein [Streptomyces griseus]WTD67029.1 carboxymuconolactone decarboxylase family protein [Streptomyces griseus]
MTTTEIKTNDRTATEATTVRPNTATTTPRLNFAKAAPKAFRAVIGLDAAAREGLDPTLVELVQIRASHLNRCAYCLHMHTTDARKAGESEERLHMVAVWQEADHFFTEKEQAALALTDTVTRIGDEGVPDEVYDRAAAHFDEEELAHLLALIFTINTWNRIALSTAKRAGTDER